MFLQDVLKTFWRRLENVLARRLKDILKTSWKRLEGVLKMYDQDEYIGLDQDVLKTSSEDVWVWSWRRLLKMKTKDVFIKTSVCWEVL